MRRSWAITAAVSVGVHASVLVALTRPAPGPPTEAAAPTAPAPSAAAPESAPLRGETFELPAPDLADPLLAARAEAEKSAPPPPTAEPTTLAARPPATTAPKAPARGAHGGAPDSAPGSAATGVYGAVGERGAMDLATAFTRGFPQAASADPVWRSTSFGAAGVATLRVSLDPSGHIENVEVTGAKTPALDAGIRRTVALLRARAFTSRARVTKLVLTATVTPDSVHDGLHGDVFAIGGSFAGAEGQAFFALATGRRIDLRVQLAP